MVVSPRRKSKSSKSPESTDSIEPVETQEIDSGVAQQSFGSARVRIDSLSMDLVEPARIDVQPAAAIVHGIALRDSQPSRRIWFEKLASVQLYDLDMLDRLPDISLATWYARRRQLAKLAISSNAVVPDTVVRESQQIRARMLRVLEYWFGDHATVAGELAGIRAGGGHQDLANDLEDVADLYVREDIQPILSQDRKDYNKEDVATARRLAGIIFKALGLDQDNEADGWTDLCHRAWTLMQRDYNDHRRAGTFLFGASEDSDETYPSLVSAVRSPSSRERVTPAPAPTPTPAPTGGTSEPPPQ